MDKDDRVRFYLRELDKVTPLTNEEGSSLQRQARTGGDEAEPATMRLIEANLRRVVPIAEKHASQRFHILEFIEKGDEALLAARKTLPGDSYDRFADQAGPATAILEEVRNGQSGAR